jgi:hypothetical protein
MGQAFTINDVEHRGVLNELKQSQRIMIGGFDVLLSASIQVAKNGFTAPAIGSKVFAGGKNRRVVAIDEDPISYTLHLEEVNR